MQATLDRMKLIALAGALLAAAGPAGAQVGTADLFASPNWALSKLPTGTCRDASGVVMAPAVTCSKDADCPGYAPPFIISAQQFPGGATCSGPAVGGTGIRKFVDTLPGLCALGTSSLAGKCIPLAVPDKNTFPGSDYYEIGLREFTERFHSDIPQAAELRGYYQINTTDPQASQNHYLGPLILGFTGRPVRMKFTNNLMTGEAGKMKIPMDATLAGAGTGPDGTTYTENRSAVHLHGGNTPWISDGTQHQWTAPVGESTTLKKGAAVAYVPDMWFDASGNVTTTCAGQEFCPVAGLSNNPGEGRLSFYWPNEQSGRLMFWHEHAYGITRLNAHLGVAAGFLLVNPPDEDALAAAGVPGTIGTGGADLAHLIPLIIQDRTFVPPASQLSQQDPTWNVGQWGGEGSFWIPHVYTPNQWPDNPDGSGTNPFGRWDYGAWFWPPQRALTSLDGQPRPLTVPCASAAAVTPSNPTGATQCPSIPNPSTTPEGFLDTPVINGVAYPTLTVEPTRYRFQILNAANDRFWNLSLFEAKTDPVAPAPYTEVQMVEAVPNYPANIAHTGFVSSPPLCDPYGPVSEVTGLPSGPGLPSCYPATWPVDARQGGVPDPGTAGPRWVQIGTESGILPRAAVIPPKPIVYEQNKRNIVVLSVSDKSLFMGPAERADVVVDFSQYAGKTLILYSDSPAPVPAADPRTDYFTWSPDLTDSGGAPTTLPGFGPNTRTLMQIKVNPLGGPAPTPLNDAEVARIDAALRAQFAASQLKPIVPESVFSGMYAPVTNYADTYIPIQGTSMTLTPVGETQQTTLNFDWKAIHELFSTDYGRMNSLLGVEVPLTTWVNQTTVPFNNMDPPTEFVVDNKPMIWKITHNGVDTHAIHFHLLNVQIVNRVGWDGQVRPPDANELGWKETVRMNPLEDIYVALQPVRQHVPWALPDMIRPLDVDRPLGTMTQFTGVDINNNPIAIANQLFNFGQEYVWHCHLLGHEEEDMLRMEIFVVAPEVPQSLASSREGAGAFVGFHDASRSAQFFTLERDTDPSFPSPTRFTIAAPAVQPGPVVFRDAGPLSDVVEYYYRVRAEKVLSTPANPGATWPMASAWSTSSNVLGLPVMQVTPGTLAFPKEPVGYQASDQIVTIANTGGGPLTLSTIALSGATADFLVTGNGCGATLSPGSSCLVRVAFKPTAVGLRTATLTVISDSSVSPTQTVGLGGSGAAANAVAIPGALTFPNQALNVTSAAKTVILTNGGDAPLLIGAVTTTAEFARVTGTSSCGTSLAVGASCNIYVQFRPTASGTRSGTLTISSNDLVHPTLAVPLSGWGNYPKATSATFAALPASPVYPGTTSTFSAGSVLPAGAPYEYRFRVFNGSATTVTQDWSTTSSWAWPILMLQKPGVYTVYLDVRANPGAPADLTRTMAFQILQIPPATSLSVSASPSSPASPVPPGTAVTFVATGGGAPLWAPYWYQFQILDLRTNTQTVVQDWSLSNELAWTAPALAGGTTSNSYRILALVRTSTWNVAYDKSAAVSYTVQ